MRSAPPTLRALVTGLVDYAGLFPPASLSMAAAVASYAADRVGAQAWMLGKFVAPIARLDELAVATHQASGGRDACWRIAAIGSGDPVADANVVRECNVAHRGRLAIDVVEQRVTSADGVRDMARATPPGVVLYLELPIADEPRALLQAVSAAGARAKVRTGGIVAEAFPDAHALARFIARCAELRVPFKATAGLHHPLRADYPLTYLPDAPRSTMFGFLGVFAAAAFAGAGMNESTIAHLLEERDPASMHFGDDVLRWRGHAVSLEAIAHARGALAIAFGSCSFREPVDDLRTLHLIPS